MRRRAFASRSASGGQDRVGAGSRCGRAARAPVGRASAPQLREAGCRASSCQLARARATAAPRRVGASYVASGRVPPGGRRSIRARLPRGVDAVRFEGNHTNVKNILGNGKADSSRTDQSTSRTTPWSRFAKRHLPSVPSLDLGTKPEARTSWAEIKDRARHVFVTALVLANGVAVA